MGKKKIEIGGLAFAFRCGQKNGPLLEMSLKESFNNVIQCRLCGVELFYSGK